jgi:hypothetical protein
VQFGSIEEREDGEAKFLKDNDGKTITEEEWTGAGFLPLPVPM